MEYGDANEVVAESGGCFPFSVVFEADLLC